MEMERQPNASLMRSWDSPMLKNLTMNQVLLIALATVLLLLAAASFYLLQDPSAPLPFAAGPPTNTLPPIPPSSTSTPSPSPTSLPTRQTSYTPFATPGTSTSTLETTGVVSGTPVTGTLAPTSTASATQPAGTTPLPPSLTLTGTTSPTQSGDTTTPTGTATLTTGEHAVTGRIVHNSTPVANVVVSFSDDDPERQVRTNSGGHFYFTTLAPGTNFFLQFTRAQNPQVTPIAEVASLAWIEGTLPTGVDVITLPDLEVSLNLGGMIFELETPSDGAAFSAASIGPNNPIQFNWTLFNQGESYFVELGAAGSDDPLWVSDDITVTNVMWNGTLDNGNHISAGSYWWRVGTSRPLGSYYFFVYTPNNDIIFNP